MRVVSIPRPPAVISDAVVSAVLVTVSVLLAGDLFRRGVDTVDNAAVNSAVWWAATGLAVTAYIASRRRAPELALAAACVAVLWQTGAGWPLLPVDLVAAAATYATAVRRPWPESAGLAAVAVAAGYFAAGQTLAGYRDRLPPPFDWHGGFWGIAALLAVAWLAGFAVRRTHQRVRRLERARDEATLLAAAAERDRLSREVHDIVAHGLSAIVVQAQGAIAALDANPDSTRTALDAIVDTGRASLGDMRRLLDADRDTPALQAGRGGIGELAQLVAGVRDAGLDVTLQVDADAALPPLPSALHLSVYRIVQEGLTNVLRHAGRDAKATVRIGVSETTVNLEIINTGTGDGAVGVQGGHGLAGMQARVAALGGQLRLGAESAGGFHVHASLPRSGETR